MAYACVKPVEISALSETTQRVSEGRQLKTQERKPRSRRGGSVRLGSRRKHRIEKLVQASAECPQLPADDEASDPLFKRSYNPPTCAFGSSGATLEKSSLDLTEHRTQQEAKTVIYDARMVLACSSRRHERAVNSHPTDSPSRCGSRTITVEAATTARTSTTEEAAMEMTAMMMGGLRTMTEMTETTTASSVAGLLFQSCLTHGQSSASCRNGTKL